MASVHWPRRRRTSSALEHHAADVERWSELVDGLPRPLIQNGVIDVPHTPGLGFTDINDDLFHDFLDPREPGFFVETSHWDPESSHDRIWS